MKPVLKKSMLDARRFNAGRPAVFDVVFCTSGLSGSGSDIGKRGLQSI